MNSNFLKVLQVVSILSIWVSIVYSSLTAKCWSEPEKLHVGFYDSFGEGVLVHMEVGNCYNLEDSNLQNPVHSMYFYIDKKDEHGYYLEIFDDIKCEGNYIKVIPRDQCSNNLAKCWGSTAKAAKLYSVESPM